MFLSYTYNKYNMKEKICGYYLDDLQEKIVLDETKHLLVVAGAGSGKTLTIIAKIKYLINNKKINPSEILCISFTKESSSSLEYKIEKEIKTNINVYTFHKLSLEILKDYKYHITDKEILDNIINKFLNIDIYESNYHLNLLKKYMKHYNYKDTITLEKEICKFIHLFKTNGYVLKDFNLILKKINKIYNINRKYEKIFLILVMNTYIVYTNYLKENNEIDFDDMIYIASNYVEKNGYKNIKYIIIDEYQDTSFIRFKLIKNIVDSTNCKLMVVGDDYQSIYRFTGCDISLFTNFKKYFDDSKILKIENTYRNSQELINVSSKFVMKNKNQIPKKLFSIKHLKKPIKIIYYKDKKQDFEKLINSINTNILVLGRYNNDIYKYINNNLKLNENNIIYKNKNIKYLTMHKSKGLECDNVIIINLEDSKYSFPSKIENKKIFNYILKEDNYLFEEERRLFYVALTRSKNNVYLFTQKNKESIFIKELKTNYIKYIEIINL